MLQIITVICNLLAAIGQITIAIINWQYRDRLFLPAFISIGLPILASICFVIVAIMNAMGVGA